MKRITAFHGTNQTFNQFDMTFGGMATGTNSGAPDAFFFTDNRDEAADYAFAAGRKNIPNVTTFEEESSRLRLAAEQAEKRAHHSGDWNASDRAAQEWEDYEIAAIQGDKTQNVHIIEARLSMHNPLNIDMKDQALRSCHLEDLISRAKSSNHDGLIMRNISDSPTGSWTSCHYAVFDANQIEISAKHGIS